MSRINQVPFGLQFLLGNANFGDNPSELNDITAPTLEQFPFLAQTLMDFERNSVQTTSIGDTVFVKVPEGEMWMPVHMLARIAGFANVGTSWAPQLEMRLIQRKNPITPGSTHILTIGPVVTSVQIGELAGFSYNFPEPTLIPSGVEFTVRTAAYISGGAPGDDSMTVHLWFYRFQV